MTFHVAALRAGVQPFVGVFLISSVLAAVATFALDQAWSSEPEPSKPLAVVTSPAQRWIAVSVLEEDGIALGYGNLDCLPRPGTVTTDAIQIRSVELRSFLAYVCEDSRHWYSRADSAPHQ